MPSTRLRVTRTLFLPRDAQIKIEYNPCRPSIRTIVCQVVALGYWVIARPCHESPGREVNNYSFTYQRVGPYILTIYLPPFDPQRDMDIIAGERFQQVDCDSVELEVTQDLFDKDKSAPYPIFKDPASEFYGLTAIQYQGEIIFWLQREYREHVQVGYTQYKEYLEAHNQGQHIYPTHRTSLSDLLLLHRVIKHIVHDDSWFLPENPEFTYSCLIRIQGTSMFFEIQGDHYECRWRRRLL